MHIKQVIISGFRSFKNQSEIDAFSAKTNVIVGRNGSGKSNFFNAIQFVLLAPKFQNLSQEERQHLLHEGAGSSVMAAYVEIIFDNSDGRLPVDSDEVTLRRTIGHKKDEFFLNRKRTQKSEIISLLESAGFSKSNPYYIVQQGKVANLCVMKDKDRLNLLKEIAGTTVYEERRSESLKIMQDAISKQDKIDEVLQFIDERLSELDKEKEELHEYDRLDKLKRALEFNLYDKELSKVNEQLDNIEGIRNDKIQQQHELYSLLRVKQDMVSNSEDRYNMAKLGMERLILRRSQKLKELNEEVAKGSELQVAMQEIQANEKVRVVEKNQVANLLQEIESLINSTNTKLRLLDPQYEATSEELSLHRKNYNVISSRMETLHGVQGRGRQFSTKKERNLFLQQQVDVLSQQENQKRERAIRLENEISNDTKVSQEDIDHITQLETTIAEQQRTIETLGLTINVLVKTRNDLQEQRKDVWKSLESFQEELLSAQSELDRGKQMMRSAVPPAVSLGLASLERIVQERRMTKKQYFGPLIDNFTLRNDAFRTAVEVAAGNSLFHVIVDTDSTAAMLMKELDTRKGGRITFLPLNRIRNDPTRYPDSTDVRPLAEVALQYEPQVEIAITQVFGKKLLARDLDIAARFSKEFQLDAVTIDGDVVNRKGGYEGGFHDERSSRIQSINKIRAATAELEKLATKETSLKTTSEELEEQVNSTLRDIRQNEAIRDNLRSSCIQLSQEVLNKQKKNEAAVANIEKRQTTLTLIKEEIAIISKQVEDYRIEMQTPFQATLSPLEIQELKDLNERYQAAKEKVEEFENNLIDLSSQRERLVADLKDNLFKRRSELLIRELLLKQSEGSTQNGNVIEIAANDLERVTVNTNTLSKELDTIDANIAVSKQDASALENEVEAARTAERLVYDEMMEISTNQDKLLNKRTMLLDTSQEKQRLMRDIGSLPRKEVEEFKDCHEKDLMSKLKDVNEKLKKYSGVNRKALDQYISFNDQRSQLIDRKANIVKDSQSIQELVDNLDLQKEEAIYRTFQGVSKHFSDVFRELVPAGEGNLLMLSALDMGEEQVGEKKSSSSQRKSLGSDISASASSSQMNVNSFQGVQVIVSFVASGQQFEMQQLSGGQKALVALALIFAIQRCDPAPFYLFDEIDQALDASYRAGVARLIQKQTHDSESPAQFIITTFRPELVAVADKCYGIALSNKMSNIHSLTKTDAEVFVTNLMTEEEAVKPPPSANAGMAPSANIMLKNSSKKQRGSEASNLNEEEKEDNDENNTSKISTTAPKSKSSTRRAK